MRVRAQSLIVMARNRQSYTGAHHHDATDHRHHPGDTERCCLSVSNYYSIFDIARSLRPRVLVDGMADVAYRIHDDIHIQHNTAPGLLQGRCDARTEYRMSLTRRDRLAPKPCVSALNPRASGRLNRRSRPTPQRNGTCRLHQKHSTASARERLQHSDKTRTKTPPAEARG